MTTRVQEGSDIERNEDQHMANDEEPRGRMMYREKQNWHADIDVNCIPMRKRKYKEREKAEERQKMHETMYLTTRRERIIDGRRKRQVRRKRRRTIIIKTYHISQSNRQGLPVKADSMGQSMWDYS